MQVLILCFSLCLLRPAFAGSMTKPSPQAEATTEDLIRRSTFIFQGTVTKLNATTMPSVPAKESTAVVRVDDVIDVPEGSPNLKGQEITVQLRDGGWAKPGQSAVFLAKGWLLGSGIAVIEVGHLIGAQAAAQIRGQVAAIRQKQRDEELQQQMATSEAVVVGRVVSVKPANIPHIGSEHDPDWYEAEIAVKSVEKGKVSGRTVTLLFPNSDDVMWKDSPKFHRGDQGIWLLHRDQAPVPGIEGKLTALKRADVRPLAEQQHLRRLLKKTK